MFQSGISSGPRSDGHSPVQEQYIAHKASFYRTEGQHTLKPGRFTDLSFVVMARNATPDCPVPFPFSVIHLLFIRLIVIRLSLQRCHLRLSRFMW